VRRAFVDTSGFYALADRDDPHHASVKELFGRAQRERWRLVTTNAVVLESHALLVNRFRSRRDVALDFLQLIETDAFQVVRINKRDEDEAIAIVRAHRDKSYSLCDETSFVVMERLRIRDAISFDQDFRSYGRFTLL
jgi:uncharacterized protein